VATEIENKDREMILSPDRWPLFYLPLKRKNPKGGFPAVALLRSASTDPEAIRIVEENMSLYGPLPGEITTHTYPDVDALLADGWMVD
jgi:hypothetical protein